MAKRSSYQAALLLRAAPPSAFDVLREVAKRLSGIDSFPPGIIPAIGQQLQTVLDETDNVKAVKAEERRAQPLATVDEAP